MDTDSKDPDRASRRICTLFFHQGLDITSHQDFFLELICTQVTQDDIGKGMVSGEFVSMTALYNAIPDLTPMPIAWGTYASDANVHFFLCSFVDMTNEIPDRETLPEKVAKLHEKAVSPNGKYGFSVPTYQGRIPQEVAWKDTWEEFFLASLKRILTVEETSQGSDAEMKQLTEQLIKRVVPRLLRPLETGGRQIQPRLVHGDLWDGNTSTDIANNLPKIFDATSIYAHNECKSQTTKVSNYSEQTVELAPWKPIRHKIGKPYIEAYHRYFPISPPKEDHDDRITLYCL